MAGCCTVRRDREKPYTLMFVHSAGNGHASFATPVVLTEAVQKRYFQWHLYLEHAAPDGRANWSPPICVGPEVDGYGKLFLMKDETMPVSHIMSGSVPTRCRSGSDRLVDKNASC